MLFIELQTYPHKLCQQLMVSALPIAAFLQVRVSVVTLNLNF